MLSKTDPTMLRGTFAPGAATERTSCTRVSVAVEIRTLAPIHVMAHSFKGFDMRPPSAMPNSDIDTAQCWMFRWHYCAWYPRRARVRRNQATRTGLTVLGKLNDHD